MSSGGPPAVRRLLSYPVTASVSRVPQADATVSPSLPSSPTSDGGGREAGSRRRRLHRGVLERLGASTSVGSQSGRRPVHERLGHIPTLGRHVDSSQGPLHGGVHGGGGSFSATARVGQEERGLDNIDGVGFFRGDVLLPEVVAAVGVRPLDVGGPDAVSPSGGPVLGSGDAFEGVVVPPPSVGVPSSVAADAGRIPDLDGPLSPSHAAGGGDFASSPVVGESPGLGSSVPLPDVGSGDPHLSPAAPPVELGGMRSPMDVLPPGMRVWTRPPITYIRRRRGTDASRVLSPAQAGFIERMSKSVESILGVPQKRQHRSRPRAGCTFPRRSRRLAGAGVEKLPVPQRVQKGRLRIVKELGLLQADHDDVLSPSVLDDYAKVFVKRPSDLQLNALALLLNMSIPENLLGEPSSAVV